MIHFRNRQLLLIATSGAFGIWVSELLIPLRKSDLPSALLLSIRILFPIAIVLISSFLLESFIRSKESHNPENDDGKSSTQLLLEDNQQLRFQLHRMQVELLGLKSELATQEEKNLQAEQLIKINEERFRNMADNIREGLTIIENDKLVYINERACQIFGDCPQGNIEQRIRTFALDADKERLSSVLAQMSSTGIIPGELQYWIKGKNGRQRCIHEHYSSSATQGVGRIFAVTSDITEQVENYQNLEHLINDRTRELSTVLEVSKRIASTLELEPLLNLILDQVESILPYSGAAIFTIDEDQLSVVAYHVPDLSTPSHLMVIPIDNLEFYLPVIREKRVMILDDVLGRSPLAIACEVAGIEVSSDHFLHARSWLGIPLVIRDRVMGLISLTHGTPGFYSKDHVRLAQTITNQVAMAVENARLFEKAQNLATLEERNRIARELHDSVTQLLYGISLYCSATKRSLNNENYKQVEQNLAEIKDNALQALREMRLLILELSPPLLQKEGLISALKSSLEVIESRTALETQLVSDGFDRLPRTVEPGLYRIAMEALNNLVRYANAKNVIVELQVRGNWIFLDIKDNGVGFDLGKVKNQGGMGLTSMEQRARQLGGRLVIQSNPGEGTCIHAEVPLV